MNCELPDVQAGFRKGREYPPCGSAGKEKAEEPEIKLPTFTGSSKKQESFQKNIYFCFTDYLKPLTVWIATNRGKF